MVPLDATISTANAISNAIPLRKPPKSETILNFVTNIATTLVKRPDDKHGPQCCSQTVTHTDEDYLMLGICY